MSSAGADPLVAPTPLGGFFTRLGFGSIPLDDLKARYASPEAGSKFVDIGEYTIHYRDEGSRANPAVFLIHGVSSSLHTWDGWAAELVRTHRVIRLDTPGFGITGSARGDSDRYDLAELFDVVEAFVDSFGLSKYALIGSSLGGFYSWNLAVRQPTKVTKIVLVDTAGYHQRRLPPLIELSAMPGLGTITRYVTPRFLISHSVGTVYGDKRRLQPAALLRYVELAQRPGNGHAMIEISRALRRAHKAPVPENTSAKVRTIRAPVLLIWGDKDTWLPITLVNEWKRDLPPEQLKVVIYPGIGHIPMEEIPERSFQDVKKFLHTPTQQP